MGLRAETLASSRWAAAATAAANRVFGAVRHGRHGRGRRRRPEGRARRSSGGSGGVVVVSVGAATFDEGDLPGRRGGARAARSRDARRAQRPGAWFRSVRGRRARSTTLDRVPSSRERSSSRRDAARIASRSRPAGEHRSMKGRPRDRREPPSRSRRASATRRPPAARWLEPWGRGGRQVAARRRFGKQSVGRRQSKHGQPPPATSATAARSEGTGSTTAPPTERSARRGRRIV